MLLSFRIFFEAEVSGQDTSTSSPNWELETKRFALQKFDVIFLNTHDLSAVRRFMTLPTYPGQKLIHFRHEHVQIAFCQLNEPLWGPLRWEQVLKKISSHIHFSKWFCSDHRVAHLTQQFSFIYKVFLLLIFQEKIRKLVQLEKIHRYMYLYLYISSAMQSILASNASCSHLLRN